MGWLERLGLRKPRTEEVSEPKIVLHADAMVQWVPTLVQHLKLDEEFSRFSQLVEKQREIALGALKQFKDEDVLRKIPERARTVNALHGNEYVRQVRKLLEKAEFTDLFTFEDEHAEFVEALSEFSDQTKKNSSALQEFMKDALERVQGAIKTIEDADISLLGRLEECQFHYVMQLRRAQEGLEALEERRQRYEELQESLAGDLNRTEDKKGRILQVIEEQRALIRNDTSRNALERLEKLEREMDERMHQYESSAKDLANFYGRYGEVRPVQDALTVVDGLQKDGVHYLTKEPARIKTAWSAAADQLEEENRGNVRNLISRLRDLSAHVEEDAQRFSEQLPQQTALKKDIIKDIAALSIYDQQQFLLRANREEASLKAKLEFLENELSPAKRIVLEREMKDAALNLGAKIEGLASGSDDDESEEVSDDEPSMEDETPEEEAPSKADEAPTEHDEEDDDPKTLPDESHDDEAPDENAPDPEETEEVRPDETPEQEAPADIPEKDPSKRIARLAQDLLDEKD